MAYIPQLIFAVFLLFAVGFFLKRILGIRKNILRGRDIDRSDQSGKRWKKMIVFALGQKKMFKKPVPALLHLMVYLGFLVVNIELLEIVLDGLLGTHRLFLPFLGDTLYTVLINIFEFFAVAVLLSCIFFLIRRNILKIRRFFAPEMTAWPKSDANLILIFEIVLMVLLLNMNASDTAALSKWGDEHAGFLVAGQSFFFSDIFVPLYDNFSYDTTRLAESVFWWAHILGIFFFANYVTYSKHLHIFLAFPNAYYSKLMATGRLSNMMEVKREVELMLNPQATGTSDPPAQEIARFGAKDANDLTWKNLLDAYSCTECGRCTAQCPANITGKKLSPRKIMMDTRDRIEEIGKNGTEDGKALLGDYISMEEIMACTTCNACVEACPVSIDPVDIILQLRRYKIMEESQGPQEWMSMFNNIETSFAPWKFAPTDRFNWANNID